MSEIPPKRVYLLTHARTASHLIERMLSSQPNTAYASHPFNPGFQLLLKNIDEGPSGPSEQQRQDLAKTWQDVFTSSWEPFFSKAAEDGKIAFIHWHSHFALQPELATSYVYGNGTPGDFKPVVVMPKTGDNAHSVDNPEIIPDAELLAPGTVPIITIRHPALMVPSIYRTMKGLELFTASDETLTFVSTLRWQRMMYDFYIKHGPAHNIKPIIVDADDYQGSGHEAFMAHLCDVTGLDSGSLLFSWNKTSSSELEAIPPVIAEIKKTILASDGVIQGLDTKSRDLKADEATWVDMFGEEGASHVKALVEKAMGEYEYLRERKFSI